MGYRWDSMWGSRWQAPGLSHSTRTRSAKILQRQAVNLPVDRPAGEAAARPDRRERPHPAAREIDAQALARRRVPRANGAVVGAGEDQPAVGRPDRVRDLR